MCQEAADAIKALDVAGAVSFITCESGGTRGPCVRLSVPLHLFVLPCVLSGGKIFRNLSGLSIIVVDTRKTDARIVVSGETKTTNGRDRNGNLCSTRSER